ncbi:MAG: hypothetical protein EB060_02635 [Proteobacteria bacterium]|nr:hypothetical protein [Pseudomonadota bacterium]
MDFVPPTAKEEARFTAAQMFQDDMAKGATQRDRLWILDDTYGQRYMTAEETEKEYNERRDRADQFAQDQKEGKKSDRRVYDDPEFGNRYATDNEVKKDLYVRVQAANTLELELQSLPGNTVVDREVYNDPKIGRLRNPLPIENAEVNATYAVKAEVEGILAQQEAAEIAAKNAARKEAEAERDRLRDAALGRTAGTSNGAASPTNMLGTQISTRPADDNGMTLAEQQEQYQRFLDMDKKPAANEPDKTSDAPTKMTPEMLAELSRQARAYVNRAPETSPATNNDITQVNPPFDPTGTVISTRDAVIPPVVQDVITPIADTKGDDGTPLKQVRDQVNKGRDVEKDGPRVS